MTPVEELRRAAALMRERAQGCELRRWRWEALGEKRYPQRITSEGNVALIAECFTEPSHPPYEAEHIASWSPPVAMAVADWLEREARHADGGDGGVDTVPNAPLAVARAYLRTENVPCR